MKQRTIATFGVGGESHVVIDGLTPGDEKHGDGVIVVALQAKFLMTISSPYGYILSYMTEYFFYYIFIFFYFQIKLNL